MEDYLVKALGFDGKVRAYAVRSTNTVGEAQKRHNTWPTATAALGRALTAGAMMGSMMNADDKITIKIVLSDCIKVGVPSFCLLYWSSVLSLKREKVLRPYVDTIPRTAFSKTFKPIRNIPHNIVIVCHNIDIRYCTPANNNQC